jgi:hypothetical protein
MCRRQGSGGTEGSNPVPCSAESAANLAFGGASQHPLPRREGGQRGFQYQKVIVAEALRYPNLE